MRFYLYKEPFLVTICEFGDDTSSPVPRRYSIAVGSDHSGDVLWQRYTKQRTLGRRYRCDKAMKVASLHTFYDALIKSKVAAYYCLRLLRHRWRPLLCMYHRFRT